MTESQPNQPDSSGADSSAVPDAGQAQAAPEGQLQTEAVADIAPIIRPAINVGSPVRVRRDKGCLHAVRHGVLARHPLQALQHLGEDPKALRQLERRFRAELKPRGIVGDLIFDRFWAAHLRCILAARVETSAFLVANQDTSKGTARVPVLIQADRPTLVVGDEQDIATAAQTLAPDVLHQLLLVQRYDRHFAREMYQALALLLVMRGNGESALEQSLARMVGIDKES